MVTTEGPLGGGERPDRQPDVTLVVLPRSGEQLFVEWSGAGHPLTADIRVVVWLTTVEKEPDHPTVTLSPHPKGLVCYLNDISYYEIWRAEELMEDGGWLVAMQSGGESPPRASRWWKR